METLRLCLVRHGETDWNAQGRIQGQLDIPLNAQGRLQAVAVARALGSERLDAIYSSDLQRALCTAHPLARSQALPVQALVQWRERHHGRMQGRTYAEVEQDWPDGHRRLRARDPDFDVEGGESLVALAQRCASALQDLRARHAQGAIALVTHGAVLDALHRHITGQPLAEPRRVPIRNCAIHWLQHDGGQWTIASWGADQHLESAHDERFG